MEMQEGDREYISNTPTRLKDIFQQFDMFGKAAYRVEKKNCSTQARLR